MFSGKTEELIKRIQKAKLSNFETIVFKPIIDLRNHGNYISSHNKNTYETFTDSDEIDVLNKSIKYQVVGIDEVQFFGLDMDFRVSPFGPMPNFMASAEFISKLHAICAKTGNMANYTHRKSKDDKRIKIGHRNEYEAPSRVSFFNKKQ